MTHNEIIVMGVSICMGVIVLSALLNNWFSEKGGIGWRVIFLEILCSAVVISALYYFDLPTESVLKDRYKEKVLQKHKKCFEQCVDTCVPLELSKD